MRWPFSRRSRGGPEAGPSPSAFARGDAAGGPDGAAAGQADGARPAERPEATWADLPPIDRTVERAPLTADSLEFASDLAGSRTPDPILRPLGHDVTADGPGGLVSGLASPILDTRARTTGGGELPAPAPGTPLGRHVGVRQTVPEDGAPDGAASARAGALGFGPLGGALGRMPLVPVAAGAREARRQLTTVQPETLAAPLGSAHPISAATPAASNEAPVAGGSPGHTMRDAASGPDTGPARGPAIADSRAAPRSPAAAGAFDTSAGGPADAGSSVAGPEPAGAQVPSLARGLVIRRSGLGAPLPGPVPADARPPGPLPRSSMPSMPRERGVRAASSVTERPPATGGLELPLATLRAWPGADEDAGAPPTSGPTEPVLRRRREPAPDRSRLVDPARGATWPSRERPLLGSDPIVPSLLATRGMTARAGAAASPSPQLPSTTSAATGEGASRISSGTGAGTHDRAARASAAAVLRASDVTTAPARSGSAVPGMGPMLAPAPAATTRPPLPAADADAIPGAPARIPRAGPIARSPAGPLATHDGSGAGPGPVRGATSAIVPAHAAATAPASSPSGIAVQRAVQVEDVAGQVTGAAGEGAAGTGAGGGIGIAAASDGDLDLLARRLYGRLRDRLAGELLLDRERAGSLADL